MFLIDLPTIPTTLQVGKINLETGQISVLDPLYFTCTSKADCCSNMKIPITQFDIQRIAEQGYEVDQIVRDLSPVIINPSTHDNTSQPAYFLKSKPYDGTCTFLEENLCGIHEFKPFACRIYPFALKFTQENQVVITINQNQICSSIQQAKETDSNNFELLEDIYKLLKEEISQRQQFAKING